jgi:hypothetical protein
MWKGAVVTYFKELSWYFPGQTEEYYEKLQSISLISGTDNNLGPTEHKARMLLFNCNV